MTNSNTQLTSSEIAAIWKSYMNDSMNQCILEYFLKDVEDSEIRSLVQQTYDFISTHVNKLDQLFIMEKLPLPAGFGKEDVNLNAPRLYTDGLMLEYIGHLTRVGLVAYSGFITTSARKDIKTIFKEGITGVLELYDRATDISVDKGLFVRPPYIPYPTKADMIDSKKYFSGMNPFSNKRPLNAVEISYLHMNVRTNMIGGKLAISFAQVSAVEKVQNWMLRGRDITKKHIGIFAKILSDNDLLAPLSSDVSITDSTIPPFSEKLGMFLFAELCALGIGNYATAAGASQRHDLIVNYERLSLEVAQYAKDGAEIMIENGWLEQPPGTVDKEKLAKSKNKHN